MRRREDAPVRDLRAAEETFASVIRCDSESTPLTFSWIFLHSVGHYAALIEDVTAVVVLYEQGGMLML